MHRRDLIKTMGITVAGLTVLPLISNSKRLLAKAAESIDSTTKLNVESTITRNHGHALELDLVSLVLLLQQARANEEFITIDIQGSSRHPHTVVLTEAQLVDLLAAGSLEVNSSVDRGHAHTITIQIVKEEMTL